MDTAIKIAQEAEQRKKEIEDTRTIPQDIIDQVKSESLPRQWVAREYGGPQKPVEEVMKIWQKMAYYNGSIAWVCSVTNCSSLITGYLSKEMSEHFFGSSHAMVGGFAGPAGMAIVQEGGLNVSGHWSWGSGISHCSHIIAGVNLIKDQKRIGAGVTFFDPADVTLIDNWHVVGMKGTHSINYSVEDLFVSDNRWTSFPPSNAKIDDPLYRFSFLGALALSISAVGLGLAERAHDEIIDLMQKKVPLGQKGPLSKLAITQDRIGKIAGNYLAAKSLFYTSISEAQNASKHKDSTTTVKAQIRLAACTCTSLCLNVVRDAYELAGGSAIWQSNKLEELHRDMHVVSQHAMASTANYRTAGSIRLGNEVPEFLL